MNDQKFYNLVGIVAAIVILAAFGMSYLGASAAQHPSAPSAPAGSAADAPFVVYLTISTLPSGADQYMPANFTVPSNATVTFVISSYDNGVNNLTPSAAMVSGTLNGTESITGGAAGTPQGPVRSLGAGDTAHTFSLLSGGLDVNAVIPPAATPSDAVQVTFSVVFHTHGTFTWMCLAPCDAGSMQAPGFMSGTIDIV
jgi:hypothetical protein